MYHFVWGHFAIVERCLIFFSFQWLHNYDTVRWLVQEYLCFLNRKNKFLMTLLGPCRRWDLETLSILAKCHCDQPKMNKLSSRNLLCRIYSYWIKILRSLPKIRANGEQKYHFKTFSWNCKHILGRGILEARYRYIESKKLILCLKTKDQFCVNSFPWKFIQI